MAAPQIDQQTETKAIAVATKSAPMEAWELINRQARALAASSLVPKDYQDNVANCIIALQLAARIGADPMMVMQNLDIIHGRPSWRSTFLIATVNASGRFTPLRFRWQGKEGTDTWGCRAVATDRSTGDECLGALITIALANAEGWSSKSGSKWKTMPEQMLMYRAASFWTRVFSPELSLGMQTTDEVIDTYGEPAGASAGQIEGTRALEAQLRSGAPAAAGRVDAETGEILPVADDTAAKSKGLEAELSGKKTPAKEVPMREPGED